MILLVRCGRKADLVNFYFLSFIFHQTQGIRISCATHIQIGHTDSVKLSSDIFGLTKVLVMHSVNLRLTFNLKAIPRTIVRPWVELNDIMEANGKVNRLLVPKEMSIKIISECWLFNIVVYFYNTAFVYI